MFYKALPGQILNTKKYGQLEAKEYLQFWYFDLSEVKDDKVKEYYKKLLDSRNESDLYKKQDIYTPFESLEEEIKKIDEAKKPKKEKNTRNKKIDATETGIENNLNE